MCIFAFSFPLRIILLDIANLFYCWCWFISRLREKNLSWVDIFEEIPVCFLIHVTFLSLTLSCAAFVFVWVNSFSNATYWLPFCDCIRSKVSCLRCISYYFPFLPSKVILYFFCSSTVLRLNSISDVYFFFTLFDKISLRFFVKCHEVVLPSWF